MRSSIHSTFATLLLLVPVGAIPALAIFGIPQFAPVVASPLREGDRGDEERRVGQSARSPADDLFSDVDDFPERSDGGLENASRIGAAVPIPRQESLGEQSPQNVGASFEASQIPNWANDSAIEGASSGSRQNFPRESSVPERNLARDRERSLRESAPFDRTRRIPPDSGIQQNKRSHDQSPPNKEVQFVSNQQMESEIPKSYQRQREQSPNGDGRIRKPENEQSELTWQEAVRRLNDLGIRNFRLEPARQQNQFIFICSMTPTNSPRVSYQFEAEADEPLKAVEKVLVQIDEWQQRK